MADNVPHNGAPPKVPPLLSPPVEVEEPAVIEVGEATEGIVADFEAEFALGLEPEPLPLRIRPFDPVTYHPYMHMLATGGMMRFDDFTSGVPEDVLLRKPYFHLSYGTSKGDSRSYRGYRAVTIRDWYYELLPEVCDLVDKTNFGFRALLRALVERW
ncbi:hypothetical protein CsSME_00007050 [Camellia sinensis var. sinensis]